MGFVYEVAISGTMEGVPIAHVYHVWDGDESEDSDDIADVFENSHIPDLVTQQDSALTWTRIAVKALDVGNFAAPVTRIVAVAGALSGDALNTGTHCWVKFESDDNGFKSGGKLFIGLVEAGVVGGTVIAGTITAIQTIYDSLISDLITAGLNLCIYRPTLSTPGFPSISICSVALARGQGMNNRRQQPYQL